MKKIREILEQRFGKYIMADKLDDVAKEISKSVEVEDDEVSCLYEKDIHLKVHQCSDEMSKMGLYLKSHIKEGWKITKTRIKLSYFLEKEQK